MENGIAIQMQDQDEACYHVNLHIRRLDSKIKSFEESLLKLSLSRFKLIDEMNKCKDGRIKMVLKAHIQTSNIRIHMVSETLEIMRCELEELYVTDEIYQIEKTKCKENGDNLDK